MTHDGSISLSTCSCDPISAVCFSTVKLFLCGLQEFSRANDGGPATTETKWRHGKTLWWWCVGGITSEFLLQECTVRCTTTNSALAAPSTYLDPSLAGWPILKVQGEICEPQVDLLLLLLLFLLLLFYVSWLSSWRFYALRNMCIDRNRETLKALREKILLPKIDVPDRHGCILDRKPSTFPCT